jgi:peptidoglycan/LPS O-acetylase OafA/YrhL
MVRFHAAYGGDDTGRSEYVMTMRLVAAAAVLVSAAVHLYLWLDGARTDDFLGPAFMLNAVSGAVIAVLLLTWRHWMPAFLARGFVLATLGSFVLATTVGLFGVTASWEGWAVWVAAASELVAIATGAALLQDNPLRSRGELRHHSRLRRAHH